MKETNYSASKICKVAVFTLLTMVIVLGIAKTETAEALKDASPKNRKE